MENEKNVLRLIMLYQEFSWIFQFMDRIQSQSIPAVDLGFLAQDRTMDEITGPQLITKSLEPKPVSSRGHRQLEQEITCIIPLSSIFSQSLQVFRAGNFYSYKWGYVSLLVGRFIYPWVRLSSGDLLMFLLSICYHNIFHRCFSFKQISATFPLSLLFQLPVPWKQRGTVSEYSLKAFKVNNSLNG